MAKLYGSLEAGGTSLFVLLVMRNSKSLKKLNSQQLHLTKQLIVRLNFSNVMKISWKESLLVHLVQLMLIQTLKHMVL